jgi:Zn-finger nucleic acid-binding protein
MRLKPDQESFQCAYCQSVYFPEKNDDGVRVLDEPTGQDCPLCRLPLVRATLAKVPISYCSGCRGFLLPMPALEALVDGLRGSQNGAAAPAPPDQDELQRKIDCPQCHRRMEAHLYGGPGNVVIDSCETCCLIWLDRGEAQRIARATPSESTFTEEASVQSDQFSSGPIGLEISETSMPILDAIDLLFR